MFSKIIGVDGSTIAKLVSTHAESLAKVGGGNPILVNPSLKLLLHMDGIAGSSTFVDSSLSNNTVSSFGAKLSSFSKWGTSAVFNGSSDYLKIQTSNDLQITNSYTMDFWFYSNYTSGFQNLVFWGTDTPYSYAAVQILLNGGKLGLYGATASKTWPIEYSGSTNLSGAWHHLALVKESDNYRMYVDGFKVYDATMSIIPYAGAEILIGRNNIYFFNGYIDEFRFSNTVRFSDNFTPSVVPT